MKVTTDVELLLIILVNGIKNVARWWPAAALKHTFVYW